MLLRRWRLLPDPVGWGCAAAEGLRGLSLRGLSFFTHGAWTGLLHMP
ncbi:hypothetical protein JCM18897A_35580 [Streptomyces sp. JCM 18897]